MPFTIIRNDITKVYADAIVNTANPNPVYGAGTDAAIYRAAGEKELLAERRKIGRLGAGEAAVTPAFRLHAKFIIHTVGPVWVDGKHREFELLSSCYRKSLHMARHLGCGSIAFPLISTGSYGFPKDKALDIALREISTFLEDEEMDVTLVVFDRRTFSLSSELREDVRQFIDENYVEGQIREEYGQGYSNDRLSGRTEVLRQNAGARRREDYREERDAVDALAAVKKEKSRRRGLFDKLIGERKARSPEEAGTTGAAGPERRRSGEPAPEKTGRTSAAGPERRRSGELAPEEAGTTSAAGPERRRSGEPAPEKTGRTSAAAPEKRRPGEGSGESFFSKWKLSESYLREHAEEYSYRPPEEPDLSESDQKDILPDFSAQDTSVLASSAQVGSDLGSAAQDASVLESAAQDTFFSGESDSEDFLRDESMESAESPERKEIFFSQSGERPGNTSFSREEIRIESASSPHRRSLQDVMSHVGESFQECLLRMIDERGLTDAEVYKRANIDRKLFSKIRCNPNYNPSRRTVMALVIALHLNMDEAVDLLRKAGMALSPGSKFDLIISYCIQNRIYNIIRINALLFDYDQPTLGAG